MALQWLILEREFSRKRFPARSLIHVVPACKGIHQANTVRCPASPAVWLLAARGKAQILAEERHHVILESVGDRAGVRPRINLKAVRDSVVVHDVMQLGGVKAQAVLVAHVH